jgi:hypothetical protein
MSVFKHSLAKMEIVMLGCTAIAFHGSLVDVRYTRTFSFPHYKVNEDNQKVLKLGLQMISLMKQILEYLEKINKLRRAPEF